MIADEREKAQDVSLRLKLALVAADPDRFLFVLFGDAIVPTTPTPVEAKVADLDDSAGEWKFTDNIDPRDAEALLASFMAGNNGGVITGADVAGDWQ